LLKIDLPIFDGWLDPPLPTFPSVGFHVHPGFEPKKTPLVGKPHLGDPDLTRADRLQLPQSLLTKLATAKESAGVKWEKWEVYKAHII
jgi:hypothetical protein